uniref:SKP1 component POZ domain-containing protein n=1 Tax=Panagrolaimus sp. ES5 TaxID=591445 RepID=A0AC34FRY2_9BILA
MSQQQNPTNFIIQSKIDNQKFTVDKNVIDASTLLKNICDITEVTEPILVDCPSQSLEVFIKLITHYHRDEEESEDEEEIDFEETLYNSFTSKGKKELIKLIQDLCILDSDIFLNSIVDYILGIFENEEKGIEMDWMEIQEYLGLENDFNKKERNFIQNAKKLEYFLSIDFKNIKFPFHNKIAKDLSKRIRILAYDIFKLVNHRELVSFLKKAEESKFAIFKIGCITEHVRLEFKNFITDYMDDDGIISMQCKIPGILHDEISVPKVGRFYEYPVLYVKNYLDSIVVNDSL